jgi:hypothetical protein
MEDNKELVLKAEEANKIYEEVYLGYSRRRIISGILWTALICLSVANVVVAPKSDATAFSFIFCMIAQGVVFGGALFRADRAMLQLENAL